MAIHFLFNIKNDPGSWNPGTVFYYNGSINQVQGVHNPEELKYIQSVYNQTHDQPLKTYTWDAKKAPVYIRLFGVLQPDTIDTDIQRRIRSIQALEKQYNKMYGDPTDFLAYSVVAIRKEPSKFAEIIGYTKVGEHFHLSKATTACDYHWGKTTYNGQEAWVAIGDIIGNTFGEWAFNY